MTQPTRIDIGAGQTAIALNAADPLDALYDDAVELGEALDAFRERLIVLDLPDDLVALWRDAAAATWLAVEPLEVDV